MDKVIHSFTISFPDWFYAVCTGAFIVVVFYLGGLHKEVKKICKDWPNIRMALIRISEILFQKDLAKDFIYSASPIRLNEVGLSAIKEAKFEEFYNANKQILLDRIKKASPKTMADLEEICKTIMFQIEENLPEFKAIKQYAYQHGEPISKILFACAVALRDISAKELELS